MLIDFFWGEGDNDLAVLVIKQTLERKNPMEVRSTLNFVSHTMCLTGSVLKKEIIRQAIVQTFGYEYLEYLLRLYEWIETHDSFVRSHIKERDADVSALFLLWIVNQKNSSESPSAEYLARLLSEWLFDKDGVNFIHKNISVSTRCFFSL